jgi:serine/threonine protein phosphatase PrpC
LIANNHQAHKEGVFDDDSEEDAGSNNSDDTTVPPFMNNIENVRPNQMEQPVEVMAKREAFILLCSDGVWEFISSHEAVRIASKFPRGRAPVAAEELARVSWDRWMIEENGHVVDDITSLVIHL